MSRSNLIDIFILIFDSCIQNSFTKLINSNQLLEASATVLVRVYYSYEVDVKNLSCLRFKITISWLEIWSETAWVQQRRYFWIDLLTSIATSHAMLLATTLDADVSKARRWEFVAAIACCLLKFFIRRFLTEDDKVAHETIRDSCSCIRDSSCLQHSQLLVLSEHRRYSCLD